MTDEDHWSLAIGSRIDDASRGGYAARKQCFELADTENWVESGAHLERNTVNR